MMVIISLLVLIIVSAIVYYLLKKETVKSTALSFKSAIELTNLPVVTFYSGHKKLNMLLDTGSSECILSKEYLDTIWYKETDESKQVFGMEGNTVTNSIISTTISYSGLKFDVKFLAADMSQPFGIIKKESGVTIHGILGSGFFTRYKYVLDFDKLMFYKK